MQMHAYSALEFNWSCVSIRVTSLLGLISFGECPTPLSTPPGERELTGKLFGCSPTSPGAASSMFELPGGTMRSCSSVEHMWGF